MNTKFIMTANALTLGIAGIILTFMPQEVVSYFNIEKTNSARMFIQILGSFFYSFAILNWMTRASIIGGIYNKPISAANFIFYFISGIALIKSVMSDPSLPNIIWIPAILYAFFAIAFGLIAFRNPSGVKKTV